MKIIHFTDSHLVAPPQRLFEMDMAARLRGAVKSISEHHADAEFCVFTGDITHWGEPAAFDAFRAIMDALPVPWYAIPGNHDLRQAFCDSFPDMPTGLEGFVQYGLDTPRGRFLLLDTLDEGQAGGTLCDRRLNWLRGEITKADGQDIYLFMHHAPMDVGIAGLDRIRLNNGEELGDLITAHTNIRHLFFGHLHRACHGSWRGIPFSTVKATAHQLAFTLDPDAPIISSREDPNYAVVLLSENGVIIHDHSYFDEDKAFTYDRGTPDGYEGPPQHQADWD
jgi:3',5'-cyclic-AMP phosphodiesterase